MQKADRPTQLKISFTQVDEDMLTCSVMDDGPGLPKSALPETHRSLGLQIVTERLENLHSFPAMAKESLPCGRLLK